ncbi:MAG: PKD domain-containing protein [Saprospiraceae bacterium]|nr:PKD domain-containing protein [Saprospiraceae bacterium]
MKRSLTFCFLFFSLWLSAQTPLFQGQFLPNKTIDPALSAQFFEYEIFTFNANALHDALKTDGNDLEFQLQLGSAFDWTIYLYPSYLRNEDYVVRLATDAGIVTAESNPEIKAYRGEIQDGAGGYVRLTIDDHFLYGTINQDGVLYLIEPYSYFNPNAPKDQFVFYRASDVKPYAGVACGVTEMQEQHENHQPQIDAEKTGLCYETELAIASDGLMFQSYGSAVGVENHNIGVMNNVAGNYDNEFNDEIQFLIVEQFISTSPANDPWTASTAAGTLLDDFTDWGPTGFSVTHDLGSLWTDRDFQGGTIGIAWLNAVCTGLRYHCLQDFSTNANFLRVLTSHEIGHNFSAGHDPSGTWIMSPTVNSATQWSTASQNSINSYYPNRPCLSFCAPPVPPVPLFSSNLNNLCIGSMVTFYDESLFNPTSWSWTFTGGTPSSSTAQNPTVTYANPGVYSVSLTVTNANGSATNTQGGFIVVGNNGTDFFFRSDFENGPGGWTTSNPDNDETWTNVMVGGSREGNRAMKMDNFNYDAVGQRDGLISPTIDLSGRANAQLEIDYAYRRYNATFRDSMVVYVSTNNGASFPTRIFAATENGSGNFATAGQSTTDFTPDEVDDWCYGGTFGSGCLLLDLSAFEDEPTLKIKIENVNGFGNNMFIDNVRIFSSCEVLLPPISDFSAQPTSGCVPLTVNFTDLSENNPITWIWNFPGAIPPASSAQNPVVIYTQPGVYDVTLTTVNLAGSSTVTKTNYIVVNGPPTPSFTYVVNGSSVDYTSTTTGTVNTYIWSFGDGATSGLANPSHTYNQDGTYQVSLTVIGPCGSATYQEQVTILTAPVPAFSSNITSGCAPLGVQFVDESTTNTTSWSWQFPGGTPATSTAQNPFVTYNSTGVYDVILTVSNAAGSSTITETAYINVVDIPNADFGFTTAGYQVNFSNMSSGATSYSWDFGDGIGNSTTANPTYTYQADGSYTVTLYATNSCGTDSYELLVEISNLPVPGFSADVNIGCVPLTVQFSDESSANVDSWSWTFPGGNPATSTDQNPVVVYENPGVFDVILTVSNSSGSNTITLTNYISVDDVPDVSFSSSILDLSVDFTNSTTNADSYSWDFGDGMGTSSASDPDYTYDADGTYTVILTATNGCGTVTASETITVSTLPLPAFSANVTSGCAPFTVQFQDESSENTTSWNWTFQGGTPGTSTLPNPVVTYDSPGLYSVQLVVSNAAGSNSTVQTNYIEVLDVPTASFNQIQNGATVDFTNTSTGANSYSWDFGDGVGSSIETDPSYTYSTDGIYTITLMASNDCGTVTSTETVTVVTPPSAAFNTDQTSGCAPLFVQFSDASSANATSWNWSFPGGNPSSSTAQNPLVEYATAGTYSVTLEVGNAAGTDVLVQTDIIVVSDVPSAGFSGTVNGSTIDLQNSSANATSYSWDFGDGVGSSTETDPSYTYSADGVYVVTLMATNACGTVTTTQTVTVVTPPSAAFNTDQTSGCAPLFVQFTDASSANATSWNWSFPGGNPSSSTAQNPLVEYATAGTYSVTLEVGNAAGTDALVQTDIIVVSDVPSAGFSGTINGSTLDLLNSSTNATSYSWDFGDGIGTSIETDPSYTYGQDGTYIVTLEATNACGTVTTTQTVVVVTPPTAGIGANVQSGCLPMTVQFQSLASANAETFEWSFPGGNPSTSTAQNPVVVYETAGTFDVVLTVFNAAGESTATEVGYIEVNDVPTAGFNNTVNGATVDFANNSSGATSYSWDFGDGLGTSGNVNPSYTYPEDGVYVVTLTATNDCGSVQTVQTVVIATAGPLAFFSSDVLSGCAPLEVQFFNESSANSETIEWSFPGGIPSSSTDPNPIVLYNNPGEYDASLTATNVNGSDTYTVTQYISVFALPLADFSPTVTGSTVDFTNLSSNGITYSWFFGDGGISDLENPTYTYDQVGTYNVILIVTNNCGTDEITLEVEITAVIPQAAFAANTQGGCAPLTVQFMDQSFGNPTSWEWTFESGTPASSTEQNPEVVFENPGTYDVSLTVSNLAGENMIVQSQYITVIGLPNAEFSATVDGMAVTFDNTSNGGTSFSWDFGDDTGSNNPSPTHVYEENGVYLVVLTVSNECGTSTFEQEIVVNVTSTEEPAFIDRFEVYPNPNDGRFQLILQGQAGIYGELQLELYNVLGQKLYQNAVDFSMGQLQQNLELTDLAKGVYFFRIQAGGKYLVKEIIIQ